MLLLSYLTVLFASSRLVDSLAADKCEGKHDFVSMM